MTIVDDRIVALLTNHLSGAVHQRFSDRVGPEDLLADSLKRASLVAAARPGFAEHGIA